MIKVCPTCGKEFQVAQWQLNKGRGKHCSRECADKSKHNEVSQICAGCGKEFEVYPSAVKNGNGKFCSLGCYNEAKRGAGNPNHRGGKNISCAVCGTAFWVTPWRMSRGAKCCSKECFDELQRRTSLENGYRDKRICIHCGKEFFVYAAELRKGGGKYCSVDCYLDSKPGTSFEPYCHKFNDKLKEYIRDKFSRKCVICGSLENGRALSVHHIDYNKLQGCSGKKWALVPLCHSCHSATNSHRWYWFNLLINYWAENEEITFHDFYLRA